MLFSLIGYEPMSTTKYCKDVAQYLRVMLTWPKPKRKPKVHPLNYC